MKEFRLGLIGWPLKHSLSPMIHQAALKSLGLDGDYTCFPIEPLPKGERALEKVLDQMRAGELQGLNVTLPHKETILGELDHITPAAESIGAVNTIFVQGSELVGDNTDQDGFLADLDAALAPAMGYALVLGAGGAARAVVNGLHERGWKVWVAARRIAQAEELAKSLSRSEWPNIIPIKLDSKALRDVMTELQLLVNATSVGMRPDLEATPWPEEIPFRPLKNCSKGEGINHAITLFNCG